MLKSSLAAAAALTTLALPLSAQMAQTGAGNPQLTCTQFLEMDETAQTDAVATLMIVGSEQMPDTDAATDSGGTGNAAASDAAEAADDQAAATDTAPADTAMTDAPAPVSPEVVRAIVNICSNSAEPS